MIRSFLQYIQYEKKYSSHTVLSYKADLQEFLSFLKQYSIAFDPKKITSEDIRHWVLELMDNGLSSRSVNRKLSVLRSFYHFLNNKLWNEYYNPTTEVVLPKVKKTLPYFFKEKEMEEVLDVELGEDDFETVRNRLIIEFFYQTGIRVSELISIKDVDVDFVQKNISIIGKRNKQRLIPIGNGLIDEMNRYIALRDENVGVKTGFLFVNTKGSQLYREKVYRIIRSQMSEVSSLQKKSPHVLRHTFATAMLNNGADLNVVKTILGHSSLAATEIYTHATFEQLQSIYKQSHPRG
ncbi:MAG: tyrosine-type recombinase/integrase [Paludibacteraceae bacterium]|nr:tyrosine-type recombinase/integrase [Paludibacteraceae bacterium]MBO7316462.1 tyrosine-type recombinase/integrase [Paludibacteraceae bacterium]